MKNFTNLKSRLATLFFVGLFVVSFHSYAQQEAMFSQYMFNTMAINPAYAGSRDVLSLTALGRYQWIGVPGAPTTYTFSMDMPISSEKMGLGLQASYDGIGLAKNTGIYLTYSYRVKVGPRSTLAFGVQGGAVNIRWALSDAKNIAGGDNVFSGSYDINKILPNVGGGIYLSNDRSYLGFSCPQILQNSLSNYNYSSSDSVKRSRTQRHFFLMMGFVIGKGNFKIKPSTMIRYTEGTPLGFDGNINFWIKDKISFGISGRISQFQTFSQTDGFDAAVGMLELQLTPQFRLGYAYDFTANRLNDPGKKGIDRVIGIPTHEAMLRYEFGYAKNKILTPRYF
ncbi:type IX secretion system membrane protein PorP/SprF [Emticicia sp. BO119]|uniref:PorP/SprF family type IX secretion system membrane protein n=1 Tax=Emticicia sp. BO119 TaxID=2757768 RepID=UPI0015F0A842|nr:type IX secretion system membrane protein PorP/SprF [Emticicia sp. BO119]MBA4853081.1 type IX secretion system membrane protein PorP/SprF [Emticicia sp. BO119]